MTSRGGFFFWLLSLPGHPSPSKLFLLDGKSFVQTRSRCVLKEYFMLWMMLSTSKRYSRSLVMSGPFSTLQTPISPFSHFVCYNVHTFQSIL